MGTATTEGDSFITNFRAKIRGKTRITLAWAFVAALVITTRAYPTAPGVFLCFIGATVRFWASGYLRKDSNLAIGGPYALTRNPLYLGTYLMALGTALATKNYFLLALSTVLFAVVYHYIILDEETKLKKIFGKPYVIYCQAVFRFFPRPWPADQSLLKQVNSNPKHRYFSWDLAMKNKAYEAYVSFAGLIGFVAGVAYFWKHL